MEKKRPMPSFSRDEQVSTSAFRRNLASHVQRCAKTGRRFVVTDRAKPQAVLVSMTEWNEIQETLEVLSDSSLMGPLASLDAAIAAGRHRPAKDVFEELRGRSKGKAS